MDVVPVPTDDDEDPIFTDTQLIVFQTKTPEERKEI